MDNLNLIEFIIKEMLTDEEDNEEQSYMLEDMYLSSNADEKERIDRCFIALCGWSLKTCLEKVNEGE